jgi:hypothetical protein
VTEMIDAEAAATRAAPQKPPFTALHAAHVRA